MLALMKPKNAVTVSIIATVLGSPWSTETTCEAAQSKGFRAVFENRNPTDDLEQHRVLERGEGWLFRLFGLRSCRILGALRHHRVIFRSAAPRRSTFRQATHPVRHVGKRFAGRSPRGAIRERQACEAQKGPSEGYGIIHLGGVPSLCGRRRTQSRPARGVSEMTMAGCGELRQPRSTRSYRPWPARSKGPA
jgi:hypothetical protein